MKNIARKPLLIILIFITAITSLYFSYRTYHSYQNYQVVQSSDIYINLIDHMDNTIQKLEKERLLSALYLGYKGKTDFQTIATQREESDKALEKLLSYIQQYPQMNSIRKFFQNISEDLRYVRSRVDVINEDYNNLLFTYYQNKIIEPLMQQSRLWLTKLSESIDSVTLYFTTFKELINMRNNLNQEQSYIAYILAKKQKMSMPDLMIWENVLKNEQFPYLESLSKKPIYEILKKSLHPNELSATLTLLRRAVLRGTGSGNYNIDTSTWMHKMQQNIDYTKETANTLYDYLKSLDFKSIIPVSLYINLLVVLLTILFLFILYKLYKKPLPLSKQKIKEKNPDIQIKHHKKYAIAKHHTQLPVAESFSINQKTPLANPLLTDDEDLPLTNIAPAKKELPVETEEEITSVTVAVPKSEEKIYEESSFSPIQLFKEIIKPYIPISQQRNISFHYAIDPSLPDICLGDRKKIKEILTLFLDVTMHPSSLRKEATLHIENIAQKKFETALSFTIKDSTLYLSPEERKRIRRGYSNSFNPLAETFSPYIKDFLKARQLVKQIDGSLQVQSDSKKGTEFIVSINLKKFISSE